MKILVIKFRHIGDVLLSSVLAKNLKEIYPDSTVDYLVNAESIDMLTLNPNGSYTSKSFPHPCSTMSGRPKP